MMRIRTSLFHFFFDEKLTLTVLNEDTVKRMSCGAVYKIYSSERASSSHQ